ncbi:hypothetical protein ALC62_15911 [Cyphomyrmex costatus]|uniref:Uncharacterized protein n=1 Tax=Cyphomyrmex costatus TaxID=456900 RepID=A0A195C075_9HYME|nr:hypothetical protein ALC62_15911 [Cyphomyrmex costatus]
MVKADSRHEKVIELRHSERLPAFIIPFTKTVKSLISIFALRLFTWQQQRGFLSSPAKTRARRRFASRSLFETYPRLSKNARDESGVMRRLYFAREKRSPCKKNRSSVFNKRR